MLKGIDVWAGTGAVDWVKLKQGGHAFAFMRAADGDEADRSAAVYLNGARAAGLKCGVYHFLRASKNYPAQIDLMLQLIDTLDIGAGDLPPAIRVGDHPHVDGPWKPADNDHFITAVDRWVNAVRDRTGAWPLIYTRAAFWAQLGNPTVFADCPLWLASERLSSPRLPPNWTRFTFWQYADQARVNGVLAPVGADYFAGDSDQQFDSLLLR